MAEDPAIPAYLLMPQAITRPSLAGHCEECMTNTLKLLANVFGVLGRAMGALDT